MRSRTAATQRDINDLADDQADLRAEVRLLASAVAEMNKALAATVARLDAIEMASTTREAPTSTNATALEAPKVALHAPTSQ